MTNLLDIHRKHWATFMDDAHQRSLYDSWWTPGTVNYWRHTRLLAPVLDVLGTLSSHSWLTVGDGAGTDAWRLLAAGFVDVVASDLDDTVLREVQAAGRIKAFRVEDAERLELADNSVDFILCKEALHHMSRPYLAIYECLRVARYGVVFIEPQDPWVDAPSRQDPTAPHYEAVGNYVYQYSMREFEKVAFGLNQLGIATRGLVDVYLPGCEFAWCKDEDPIWLETRQRVEQAEAGVANATVKPNYIQAIFFKNTVTPEAFAMLAERNPGWRFTRTDTNPHLAGAPSA